MVFNPQGGITQPQRIGWVDSLISMLGIPSTGANRQFLYDWTLAEGGSINNPLNTGSTPYSATGNSAAGGAAGYQTEQSGLQGTDYFLHESNYKTLLANLESGASYSADVSSLVSSPWAAGHYAGGFPTTPIPGGSGVVNGIVGSPAGSPGGIGGILNTAGGVGTDIGNAASGAVSFATDPAGSILNALKSPLKALEKPFESLAVRVGLVIFGAIAVLVGVAKLTGAGSDSNQPQGKPTNPSGNPVEGGSSGGAEGDAEEAAE